MEGERKNNRFEIDSATPLISRLSAVGEEHVRNSTRSHQRLLGFLVILAVSIPLVLTYVSPMHMTSPNFVSEIFSEKDAFEKLSEKTEDEKQLLFQSFQDEHQKTYLNEEEKAHRYEIFKENLLKIDEMNMKQPLANHHITPFSDLTVEEFRSYNGLSSDFAGRIKTVIDLDPEQQADIGFVPFEESGITLEEVELEKGSSGSSFDWRSSGAVTPVKNQMSCGGCWAFAAVGDMEGTWKLKTGQLVSLSEEEILSCATSGNGCNGGLMNDAYEFVIKNRGLESESEYPFSGSAGKCQMSGSSAASISGWTLLKAKSVAMLQSAVRTQGPVAVAINADQMQFYRSGIDVCMTSAQVNHGVLIVGYGSQNGEDFWIIKNSWGSSWGQNGYYYISTANGACGVGEIPMKSL